MPSTIGTAINGGVKACSFVPPKPRNGVKAALIGPSIRLMAQHTVFIAAMEHETGSLALRAIADISKATRFNLKACWHLESRFL